MAAGMRETSNRYGIEDNLRCFLLYKLSHHSARLAFPFEIPANQLTYMHEDLSLLS